MYIESPFPAVPVYAELQNLRTSFVFERYYRLKEKLRTMFLANFKMKYIHDRFGEQTVADTDNDIFHPFSPPFRSFHTHYDKVQ